MTHPLHTSRAGFIFILGVSFTLPCWLFFFFFFLSFFFLSGGFLLHIPCWRLFFKFFIWGVSLTRPVLASFLSREFLLHIPCWLNFYLGSFSYTSRAGFIFIWGVSLTHPVLASIFIWEVSLTHPMLALFFFGSFLLHICTGFLVLIPCRFNFYLSFSYTSRAGFFFMWGVSLTHHVLALFLSGEFLLHIPCLYHFYMERFSDISHAGFFFFSFFLFFLFVIWGVSLTHPMLVSFLSGEFLSHIPLTFPMLASLCW